MGVEEMRHCVEEEWDRLDQEVIDNDNAISEWRKRLTACALNIHSERHCICSQ